jgi:ABC-type multidrug transport system ATPase subunit
VIEIIGVCKTYDKRVAVENINLSVKKGEVLALVGPNGSGKSTLLKIICTLLRPSSGTVNIFGHNITSHPIQVRQHISYLPEKVALWDELSAYENLYYWGKIRYDDSFNMEIPTLLKKLKLKDENKIVSKYSKGMRQRVAIGLAFLGPHDILLLDEPTSGLDPDGRFILRDMINDFMKNNNIVILSTHDILEVTRMCTRVIFMKTGKIIGIFDPRVEDVEVKYKEIYS